MAIFELTGWGIPPHLVNGDIGGGFAAATATAATVTATATATARMGWAGWLAGLALTGLAGL